MITAGLNFTEVEAKSLLLKEDIKNFYEAFIVFDKDLNDFLIFNN